MRLELDNLVIAVIAWSAAALLAGYQRARGAAFRQAPVSWSAAAALPIVGLLALFGVPLELALLPLFPAMLLDRIIRWIRPDEPTEDERQAQEMTDRLRNPRMLPPPGPWSDDP